MNNRLKDEGRTPKYSSPLFSPRSITGLPFFFLQETLEPRSATGSTVRLFYVSRSRKIAKFAENLLRFRRLISPQCARRRRPSSTRLTPAIIFFSQRELACARLEQIGIRVSTFSTHVENARTRGRGRAGRRAHRPRTAGEKRENITPDVVLLQRN